MPKYLHVRPDFSIGQDEKGNDVKIGTRKLVDIACTYIAPSAGGLIYTDVLMHQDIRDRFDEAKQASFEYVKLSDVEYNHLKKKVEDCRWTLFGPDVTQFIRDVRDAKDGPPKPATANRG